MRYTFILHLFDIFKDDNFLSNIAQTLQGMTSERKKHFAHYYEMEKVGG